MVAAECMEAVPDGECWTPESAIATSVAARATADGVITSPARFRTLAAVWELTASEWNESASCLLRKASEEQASHHEIQDVENTNLESQALITGDSRVAAAILASLFLSSGVACTAFRFRQDFSSWGEGPLLVL